MTVSTVASISRPRVLVSRRYSDSGVVTIKLGRRRSMRARCAAEESPVRTATLMGAGTWPSSIATAAISARGRSRFWAMSTARAFSGDTYTTRVAPDTSSPAACARYSESIATRNPARVFPEPVGAAINVSRPSAISGQPSACASVGPSAKRRLNHSVTAGWKPARSPARVASASTTISWNRTGRTDVRTTPAWLQRPTEQRRHRRRAASRAARHRTGRPSCGVVKDHPERVPAAGLHLAHPMPQTDPVHPAGTLNGSVIHREDHAVAQSQRHDHGPRLHPWPLLDEDKLTARKVPLGLREQKCHLHGEDVLAVQILVQTVVVAADVLQQQRGWPRLPRLVAARNELGVGQRIAAGVAQGLVPAVRMRCESGIEPRPQLRDDRR